MKDELQSIINDQVDIKNNWNEEYSTYYMKNFGTPKLMITNGLGSKVWDSQGKEYIDLLGGIAVNSLGHANPKIISCVNQNVNKLTHVSNFFTTTNQIELAKKISEIVGFEHKPRVLFTNSGTESVEGALKIAKKHANDAKKPNSKIIALKNSFHGRTLGALSVTSKDKYRNPFNPLIPNVKFIDANVSELKAAFDEEVCCIILECIQGEGGVIPLKTEFIKKARELCNSHNALLIIDEVQTGIGRTGQWFAYQSHDILPDILILAKGLGGGFPIGAIVTLNNSKNKNIGEILSPGDHGTTFGGNPLCCGVALTVIKTIEDERLLHNAKSSFDAVKNIINSDVKMVKNVRGAGLLIGIELTENIALNVVDQALKNGVILNAVTDNTIRIAPALNISPIDLHRGIRILLNVLKGFEK